MQRAVTSKSAKRTLSQFALALALSVGTFGGMLGFASLTEPAQAAGSGAQQQVAATTTPTAAPAPAASAPAERPQPRVVRINGFANCAVVKQVNGANGKPAEFRCDRSM
ncbi:MAG: hypothetical protein FD175_1696 [Beijerinckiaceae bacterium]|nr:MAG: hypothetical protein FD175_1696 [Beijerinckiaceae bacterium]